MDDRRVRLTCTGFSVGALSVPAFELRGGDIVWMALPEKCYVSPNSLLRMFAMPEAQPAIRANGKMVAAELPLPRSRVIEFFHPQRAIDWLSQKTGCLRSAAASELARLELPPEIPMSWLAGTPRTQLGVLAALAQRPGVLLVDTAWLDPLGIRRVLSALANELGDAAAICLSQKDDVYVAEFPFTSVIEIRRQEAETVARN